MAVPSIAEIKNTITLHLTTIVDTDSRLQDFEINNPPIEPEHIINIRLKHKNYRNPSYTLFVAIKKLDNGLFLTQPGLSKLAHNTDNLMITSGKPLTGSNIYDLSARTVDTLLSRLMHQISRDAVLFAPVA